MNDEKIITKNILAAFGKYSLEAMSSTRKHWGCYHLPGKQVHVQQ
jgi:hypothetical protein